MFAIIRKVYGIAKSNHKPKSHSAPRTTIANTVTAVEKNSGNSSSKNAFV